MSAVLYSFRRCPYAMRARMALHLAEADYEHREVSLRDKPDAMLAISPKGSVPVFVTPSGDVLDESLDIMRWALPDRAPNSAITDMIDGPFKHHLDRYKYASRYDETLQRGDVDLGHRVEAVACLRMIEDRLDGQAHLDGAEAGPTDWASFPFVRQFAAVEPEWWAGESGLPRTRDWLAGHLASDLFKAVMVKHPLWTPDPSA